MIDERYIRINGSNARIIALLDELLEETNDPAEAVAAVYQFDNECKPEGIKQIYHVTKFQRGSLEKVPAN